MASPPTSTRSVRISLISYGHANGPIVQQQQLGEARYHRTLAYSIRHLPNPPRHLRANSTGLSRRLQKEFLQNDEVERFLVKVQEDILNKAIEGCHQLSDCTENQDENCEGGSDDAGQHFALKNEQPALECGVNIDLIVAIYCEEGRHRSIAFIEELARRLAVFKDEDDASSRDWEMTINVIHRDIGDGEEGEQFLGQNKRPNKFQAKTRQRQRREKEDRYNLLLGDDG